MNRQFLFFAQNKAQRMTRRRIPQFLLLTFLLLGASAVSLSCTSTSTPSSSATLVPSVSVIPLSPTEVSPTTRATPASPTAALQLSPTELKYRLLDQYPQIFFCDPDLYPVARMLDDNQLTQRVTALAKNSEEYQTILRHHNLDRVASLSKDQRLIVYGDSKKLNAILLEPSGDGFKFSLRISAAKNAGFLIEGLIDSTGVIRETKRESTVTTCPICLAGNTRIDTPIGFVPVKDVQKGMLVWTADSTGARELAVVLETAQRSVPADVLLVHLILNDGRELTASAGHPTADGRVVGDFSIGDRMDGAQVISVTQIPDADGATFDLLPSGETGSYWANGILLKSTLASGQGGVSK